MNLKQKLITGILIAGSGLAGLLNGGCEPTLAQNMAITGSAAQYAGATNPNLSFQQGQALGALGGIFGLLSQQEAMKEAAEAGKTEVIIINQGDNQTKEPLTQERVNQILGRPSKGEVFNIGLGGDFSNIPFSKKEFHIMWLDKSERDPNLPEKIPCEYLEHIMLNTRTGYLEPEKGYVWVHSPKYYSGEYGEKVFNSRRYEITRKTEEFKDAGIAPRR